MQWFTIYVSYDSFCCHAGGSTYFHSLIAAKNIKEAVATFVNHYELSKQELEYNYKIIEIKPVEFPNLNRRRKPFVFEG